MMVQGLVHAVGISKAFGATVALDGVDLTLDEGAFVALLGPAGAGKTTMLRILAGLEVPDAGSVVIKGSEATALPPKDRDVAMIFDSIALYPNKTGFENIANPLRVRGLPADEVTEKVKDVARTLHVSHILSRKPRTMSGGERQRIALGRALVRNPTYFLLDEPLSSLDAKLRVELRAELRRLQRDRGATFLYATPDFTEAMAVADRIVMLMDGRVRQVDTPQALYDAPADRDVASFVGAPKINLVDAVYLPSDGGIVRLGAISAPASETYRRVFRGQSRKFEAGIRPEQIALRAADGVTANARIIDSEPLGLRSAVTVATDGGVLRASLPEHLAARLGMNDPVAVSFDLTNSLAFDPDDGRLMR